LGILLVTAGIGSADRLPALSVGITLQIPDILLVGSLGYIVVRSLALRNLPFVRTPLDRPLLIFYGVTLLSTLLALVQSSLDRYNAIASIRIFSYYLSFFVVTNLVRERRQLDLLLNGIFLLATLIAGAMIVQYMLGNSVQIFQDSASLDTQGKTYGAVTRIVPPGFSLLLVTFVTSMCLLVMERFKPIAFLRWLQCGLLAVAFLVTFLRSYYAPLILVVLLICYLTTGEERRRLIGYALWGVVITTPVVLVLLVAPPDSSTSRLATASWRLVNASWERLSTLGQSRTFGGSGAFQGGDNDTWVDYRAIENAYAWSAIASHPVIGLGLGASYRPLDPKIDGYDARGLMEDRTHFIHNSHLGVLLQSGLLGYLSLTWLSLAFLLRGFKNWRKAPNARLRAVVLGFTLAYLAVLIAAGANNVFMDWSWVPVLGIIIGINEVILRQNRMDDVTTRLRSHASFVVGR
jgi:hypothetical protein